MIDAKLLLPFVLAALAYYTRDNALRIKELKGNNFPGPRAAFLAGKLAKQFAIIVVMPAICLIVSHTFRRALDPGPAVQALAMRISSATGVTGRGLQSLVSPRTAVEVALAVLLLEAIPVIRGKGSPVALGDVSILLPRSSSEYALCAGLAVNAGVGEELLFRGFMPLAIAGFKVPFEIALILSALLFAACHLYQGPVGILATGFAAALLTAAYIVTGSLLFVIAIHVAVDLLGLVVRPLTGLGLRRMLGHSAPPRN